MSNFSALIATIQANIKTNGNEEITGAVLQDVLEAMVQALGTEAINNLETALGNEETARQNADGTLQNNIDAEALRAGTAEAGLGGRLDTIEAEIPSAASSSNKLADKAFVTNLTDALQAAVNGIKSNIDNGYVYAGIATPSITPVSGKVFYLALTAGTYTNFGSIVVPQGINILKYNGSAWSLDNFLGLDDAPTQGSNNLVKSGGVLDSIIKNGSAFDLSAYNNGTTYADLSAALTALNVLPAAYKNGGMSIKYVQTSDNKYQQYRLMSDSFNTTVANWQGVDVEPTAGSKNLVESGSLYDILSQYDIRRKSVVGGGFYTNVCNVKVGVEYITIVVAKTTRIFLFTNNSSENRQSITNDAQIGTIYEFTPSEGYNKFGIGFVDANSSVNYILIEKDKMDCYLLTQIENMKTTLSGISTCLSVLEKEGNIQEKTFANGGFWPNVESVEIGIKYNIIITGSTINRVQVFLNDSSENRTMITTWAEFGKTYEFTPAEGYDHLGLGFAGSDLQTINYILRKADTTDMYLKSQIDRAQNINSGDSAFVYNPNIGNVDFQPLGQTDYSHILIYGQSLSTGSDSRIALTTTPIAGNYMLGNNVAAYDSVVFSPLVANDVESTHKENAIIALTNSLSQIARRKFKDIMFLATSAGYGDRTIAQLSDPTRFSSGITYVSGAGDTHDIIQFTQVFEQQLRNARAAANAQGKTISLSAIIFMQGEADYGTSYTAGGLSSMSCEGDKQLYKQRLINLKNDMQAAVMEIYGQTKKPLFFMSLPHWAFLDYRTHTKEDLPIHMAQIEAALENDDMFIMNPTYPCTSFNGHMASNGYRWYGELAAKTVYEALVNEKRYLPPYPMDISVDNGSIIIKYYVPTPPLVIDNYTTYERPHAGFRVFQDNVEISNISVMVSTGSVRIETGRELSGTIEVSYGNTQWRGMGNLRDSDRWKSMYIYNGSADSSENPDKVPLDADGQPLNGKDYPMWNWAVNFYKKIILD